MHTTLTIKDLSASLELDAKAMSAVRGGQDNQANGLSQLNGQGMAALANVGNGSLVLGPTTIQSDNSFTQHAYNTSFASNADLFSIGRGLAFPLA